MPIMQQEEKNHQNLVRSPLHKMFKCNSNSNTLKLKPLLVMILSLPFNVEAQDRGEQNLPQMAQTVHPSKGVVIAVLFTMFATTFLLIFYVKFCRVNPGNSNYQNFNGRISGIDKQVVEALPFFKFSSLKGSKEGLECIVCLTKFEDTETLRLLPKCKHAFHVNCIDKWFESHSTCPLCRRRVEAGDIKNFNYSLSSRSLRVPSNLTEDPNLEIFVEREPPRKQELLVGDSNGSGSEWKHVINHKIVISDVLTRSRWSDLNSSDMLSLNSEMLGDMCSTRLCPLESTDTEKFHFRGTSNVASASDEEENWFTALNPAEKRSMSEIANVPRFAQIGKAVTSSRDNERVWRVWMPIARTTVQWFAKQQRNSVQLQHKTLASKV